MKLTRRTFTGMAGALLAGLSLANGAVAQKQGGTLVMIVQPEPPSPSPRTSPPPVPSGW